MLTRVFPLQVRERRQPGAGAAPDGAAQQSGQRLSRQQHAGGHRLRRQPGAHRGGDRPHRRAQLHRHRRVPVRSGIASDIAVLASPLDTQGNDPTQRIAVVADPRSNSVLVRAGSPARTAGARTDPEAGRAAEPRRQPARGHMRNAQATPHRRGAGRPAGPGRPTPPPAPGPSRRDRTGRAGGARAQRTSMNQGGQQGLGSSSSTSSNKGGLSGEQDRIARDDNGNQAVSYSAGGATSRPIRPPTR